MDSFTVPVEKPEEESSTISFTLSNVLQILKNLGHDTDCGACMGIAFTGMCFEEHTCKEAVGAPPLEITYLPEPFHPDAST